MRLAHRLASGLLAVMVLQASTGIAYQAAYRDVAWIRAAWLGNDWVTLVVAVPLLYGARISAGHGSLRGMLVWVGVGGYAVYNYAFYLFGAALNAFFSLYVAGLVVACLMLAALLSGLDVSVIASLPSGVRGIGVILIVVSFGLATAWLAMWAGYVFAARPTLVDPDIFRLVAALDLSLMAPALAAGGILLLKRAAWGLVIGAAASVQAALYLLVLTVNSAAAAIRDVPGAVSEAAVWAPLMLAMTVVAAVLLACSPRRPQEIPLAAANYSR